MCGILGLLGKNISQGAVERFNSRLAHRGPDEAGYYFGAGVALAARRLSIIDLAGGHQPLSNENETVWITYNGEIFNAPELRAELRTHGHVFKTETDTEVVVHAYEEWGCEAVRRLHGMFAFGVWDVARARLWLARDRFGIKPLYYAENQGVFAFASEVRPVLEALTELPRRLQPLALSRLFELGFIPSPLTAIAGIHKLPAAHSLIYENGQTKIERYWELNYPAEGQHRRVTAPEAAEEFTTRLREAVRAWRLSDVPVGALLSGGIDSAALAALLTETSGQIHTFTIGFAQGSHDESAQARLTARHLASHHHELTFSESDFDLLPQVVRHLEEPQCSATSVPIYLLYRACREAGFKVILTGEGADELLGGYHWFEGDRVARPLLKIPRGVRAALARLPLRASAAARRVLARGTADVQARYALWQEVSAPAMRRAVLTHVNGWPPFRVETTALNTRHPLDQFLWLEAHTRMIDFINFEVDRMSMANSVEARPPFLDHQLWEFCASLPPDYKLSPRGNKLLLRTGLQKYLPPAVLAQPKRGLASPHAAWFRAARLPAWAEDALSPSALQETGYFVPAEVQRLRAAHQAQHTDASRLLMGVLTAQIWHQEFAR
jgi:asparagine synthase (glutamine-hydrolysing)